MSGSNQLALDIVVSKDVDGLEMGVLADGTAYLSGRSLARLCGTAPSTVIEQAANWKEGKRDGKLARMLTGAGVTDDTLYVEVRQPAVTYAYPDTVCMLLLEYYAFESDRPNRTALDNYRKLARTSLKALIYAATGYGLGEAVPERWRQFHDRMLLNRVPQGHFSVFREMSDLVLAAIQRGLVVDAQTVPDISVGLTWSAHWVENSLERRYGPRSKFEHIYPDYFPQSKAGPVDAWVYPLPVLGPFREWLQSEYLPKRFPTYLAAKVRQGLLQTTARDLILEAVAEQPALS